MKAGTEARHNVQQIKRKDRMNILIIVTTQYNK